MNMGTRNLRRNRKRSLNKMKSNPDGMNSRHREFADIWLSNGMQGTAAARELGYKAPGMMAKRILSLPAVRAYVEREKTKLSEQLDITKEELIGMMRRVLKFNMMRIGRKGKSGFIEVSAEDYDRVADEIGDCVTEVETKTIETEKGTTTIFRIKIMSKEAMFQLAMKYKGLLADHVEHRVGAADGDKFMEELLPRLMRELEAESNVVDAKFIEARSSNGHAQ